MTEHTAQWLSATLNDAAESLADALGKLDAHMDDETARDILKHDIVEVYAKLNYAVNTAPLGSKALEALTEDELVAWPAKMPFLTFDEIDSRRLEEKGGED